MDQVQRCDFCCRCCLLQKGEFGECGVRYCDGNAVIDSPEQKIVAVHLDRIEKKPLYHFFPKEKTLSLGALGCNLHCTFCQNYQLSQKPYINDFSSSLYEDFPFIRMLSQCRSRIMSYTYNEPIVWQDVVLQIAEKVRQEGGFNVMVTNGTFSEKSLEIMVPHIDAFNIDFKGDESFYEEICKAPGAFRAVSDAIEYINGQTGKVLEVTTLVIEKYHTQQILQKMFEHLMNLGVNVIHLSRFFPAYKMSGEKSTSISYLEMAKEIAQQCGIPYVYLGNASLFDDRYIVCPRCGCTIERNRTSGLADDKGELYCPSCGDLIYGRFA
ncbi:MAG: radical SAM protein [Spirochaetaceae bacterium JB067]